MEPSQRPTVAIVDDDPGVLQSIRRALELRGYDARSFSSASALLADIDSLAPACVIADLLMPDLPGLDLQRKLRSSGCECPVIFITGNGDIRTSVRAMLEGAVDFLTKPIELDDLMGAVVRAIDRTRLVRERDATRKLVRRRAATLTPRERQVFEQVVAGLTNKRIAANLGISEKTVKVHRGKVMHKMKAQSLPDLVRAAEQLEFGRLGNANASARQASPGDAAGPFELGT